ncbi:hypothetical protein LIER_12403 [Lithospermum erythrorhizon]|uniref:Uncharacterized protein n=1 Tax=Lithospermum erythrorhizon TaxID=34254 RepID=A0AAV3PRK6_LITER
MSFSFHESKKGLPLSNGGQEHHEPPRGHKWIYSLSQSAPVSAGARLGKTLISSTRLNPWLSEDHLGGCKASLDNSWNIRLWLEGQSPNLHCEAKLRWRD